ncbi:exodeoxyribonuclease VII large subunit, partial [Paenibacillus sepulcri]|nr:exodeoxyribonuclease VII large subunit [Paenibacillus sepulcri]
PTPTAAAELAVANVMELQGQLNQLRGRLDHALRGTMTSRKERLLRIRRSPLFVNPRKYLLQQAERLDRLKDKLEHRTLRQTQRRREKLMRLGSALAGAHPGEKAAYARARLRGTSQRLESTMISTIKTHRMHLTAAIRQLDALSPLKVMSRGYSLVYDEQEKTLIKSITNVQLGDMVKVKLSDGQLECQVWGMKGEA